MDEKALKELKRLRVYDDEGHYVMTFMEAVDIIEKSFLDKIFERTRVKEVEKPFRPRNYFDAFKDSKSRD